MISSKLIVKIKYKHKLPVCDKHHNLMKIIFMVVCVIKNIQINGRAKKYVHYYFLLVNYIYYCILLSFLLSYWGDIDY